MSANGPHLSRPDHVPAAVVYDFDYFTDPGMIENSHARVLEMLREAPPVFWTPRNGGHWILQSHAAIFKASRDPESFTVEIVPYEKIQAMKAALPPGAPEPLVALPNSIDPPRHSVYRAPLQGAFAPKAIMALKDDIRQLAAELIEAVRPRGRCEFMAMIGEPMPVTVFLKLFGLPVERQKEYRALVKEHFSAPGFDSKEAQRRLRKVADIMRDTILERRDSPRNDMISLLWQAEFYGKPATLSDLENYCVMLFLAGLDTVMNGMGMGMRHLADHPQLQAELRANPKIIPEATEELIRRYTFTIPPRFVAKDMVFEGLPMKQGEMALLFLPAADLDPEVFPNPAEFDLARENKVHIAFGAGPHRCLGSHLARIELQILYEEVMARLPEFRIDPAKPVRYHGGNVWGPDELHLIWEPVGG
jgi:cytochrome P450